MDNETRALLDDIARLIADITRGLADTTRNLQEARQIVENLPRTSKRARLGGA